MQTRSTAPHWLYGKCLFEFDSLYLPSELEICQRFFYMKSFYLNIKNNRQFDDSEKVSIKKIIANEIIDIWKSSSIPYKDEYQVECKLKNLIDQAEVLDKNNIGYRWEKLHDKNWISDRQNEYKLVFDISQCPCFKKKNVKMGQRKGLFVVPLDQIEEIGVSIHCTCNENKRPDYVINTIKGSDDDHSDLEFYKDNLDVVNGRKLTISASIDKNTTKEVEESVTKALKKIESSEKRKKLESEQMARRQKRHKLDMQKNISVHYSGSEEEENLLDDFDKIDVIDESEQRSTRNRNTYKFPSSTQQAARFGLSYNSTMILTNTVINDYTEILKMEGIDVPNHEKYHVSTHKVVNMRNELGLELSKEHLAKTHDLVCLGLDGKKSFSKTKYCGKEILDKVSVNSHPGAKYVDHFGIVHLLILLP